jgi:Protein of unknown function (DUF1656)
MDTKVRTMTDTKRILITELGAENARTLRGRAVRLPDVRQRSVTKHPSRSFVLVGLIELMLFIPRSIAAVFPRADEATLEAAGKFNRWIHWGQPELNIAGLLIPWLMFVGALGFLAAWLVMAILEDIGLSRHLWHLPLFFVALFVLFSSLIGTLFFP